ncbi:MAG: dienelactone hydrolase family protein, partial [Solirubrobacteraceae bacterium]|nr:dienelactone hydrolase family protein [Solirubrobacteraceae bacterium]
GRTDPLPRDEDFDKMAATAKTEPEQVQDDLAAAIAVLRERTGTEDVVVVGFCFGGTNAYLSAANDALGLAGVVAFYGGLTPDRFGYPHPVTKAAEMHGPILGLFGEGDASIPAERVSEFGAALAGAGVHHEFHGYPDAPHGFFDHGLEAFAGASQDAWERVLDFLGGIEAKAHATA